MVAAEKTCIDCSALLTIENWTTGRRKAGHYVCKTCTALRQKKYVEKWGREKVRAAAKKSREKREALDPEKYRLAKYASNIKSWYGITIEDYFNLLNFQNNCCAICKSSEPRGRGSKKMFHVDHDHKTGEVRGLLCQQCNVALGSFNDDAKRLEDAIFYLKNPSFKAFNEIR